MNSAVQIIPISNLVLTFVPVMIVISILHMWSLGALFIFCFLKSVII